MLLYRSGMRVGGDVCFEKKYTSFKWKKKPSTISVFLDHKGINDKEVRRTKKHVMSNPN